MNIATVSYNWNGLCIVSGSQSPNPVVNCPGLYSVTVTNTVNGCTSTASATVTQDIAIPTASAGPDQTISCQQTSVTLNGSGNAGGAPVQFSWTGQGINAGNQNAQTPTVSLADT